MLKRIPTTEVISVTLTKSQWLPFNRKRSQEKREKSSLGIRNGNLIKLTKTKEIIKQIQDKRSTEAKFIVWYTMSPAKGPSERAKRPNHVAAWFASVLCTASTVSIISVLKRTSCESP